MENNNNQLISFANAVVSVKDGAVINESALRECTVYAKLMLNRGTTYSDKQFMYSGKGNFIRAELFILGKSGQIIYDNRMFVNIDPTKSPLMTNGNIWFVELQHPTLDLSQCTTVDWE